MNIKIDPDGFSRFLLFFFSFFFFFVWLVDSSSQAPLIFIAVRDLRRHVSFPLLTVGTMMENRRQHSRIFCQFEVN